MARPSSQMVSVNIENREKSAIDNESDRIKVALVRGPLLFSKNALNNEATPAIALAYIAGTLKKNGYDPVTIDSIGEGLNRVWPAENYPGYDCQGLNFEEILARIPNDVQAIGVNAMFSGEWPITRDLILEIKNKFPDALIIAGGEHVTALPGFCLEDCPGLDVCVKGEGENTFLELLEALGDGRDFAELHGLVYRGPNGEIKETAGLPRVRNVDDIAWPDWKEGYLERFWAAGKSYGPQTERDMPMTFSRGCPFQCTFCSNPTMWTTRYVLRDVDDVIAEVKHHIDRYNITAVQLYDLTAITKKRWAVELFTKLIDEGIKLNWSFPSGTRSEALDEETLQLLKDAGCNYLVFAPESGSPRMLKKLKKQIDLEKITQSIVWANKIGLVTRANIIIGFPGERRSDLFKTLWYGILLSMRGVDEVQPNIFSPYPGSEIFNGFYADGNIELNDEYFLGLTSLNSDLTIFNPLTINEWMGSRELAFYRLVFTALNYGIGYLFYPSRIVRTIRNLVTQEYSTTVFEHRIKDAFRRKFAKKSDPA
jgi:anaerobic magnesium-protoporphyrin IX monomethyl ester cyclase